MTHAAFDRAIARNRPTCSAGRGIRGDTRSWPLKIGGNRCVCSQCGDGFSGIVTFDRHQRLTKDGQVVCLSEAQMRAKGWDRTEHGGWWSLPAPTNLGKP